MDDHFNAWNDAWASLQALSIPTRPRLSSLGLLSVTVRVRGSVPLSWSPTLR